MTTNLYLLTPQSNLHVGAGSSNYGVIDNLVQRDVVDQYPNINASSLKGALREFFEEALNLKSQANRIFGSADEGKGSCTFSEAHLLGLPVRSNKKPYFMATCPYVLNKFLTVADEYGYPLKPALVRQIKDLAALTPAEARPIVLNGETTHLKIEDYTEFGNETLNTTELRTLLGENIVLLCDDDFQYQCGDYALPVLARNQLDNGISKNLWYEQVVPRLSPFYFLVDDYTSGEEFDKPLRTNSRSVQVGGNATVGYGRCKITNFNALFV